MQMDCLHSRAPHLRNSASPEQLPGEGVCGLGTPGTALGRTGWEGTAQKPRSSSGSGAGDPASVTPSWTVCAMIIFLFSLLKRELDENRSLCIGGKGNAREKLLFVSSESSGKSPREVLGG